MKNFKPQTMLAIATLIVICASVHAQEEREWSDASGNFTVTGTFVAMNETTMILEKEDESLVMIPIDHLSDEDKEYLDQCDNCRRLLQSEIESIPEPPLVQQRDRPAWTLNNGTNVSGHVIEHVRQEVVIRLRRGVVFVNDRRMENLPDFYQKLVPIIAGHFENREFATIRAFKRWLARQNGSAVAYTVEGVLIEAESGDVYGVPFFLFAKEDLRSLKLDFDEWVAAEKDYDYRSELALRLRALAIANQRNQQAARQLQRLHVQLQAYDAGLFDLWQVTMMPSQNRGGLATQVIVPARDSRQAGIAAQRQFPQMRVGAIAKVIRKN